MAWFVRLLEFGLTGRGGASMTERYCDLYRACGCAGWLKGHPYDPQPHYIQLTIRQASRALSEAKKPQPEQKEPETVYFVEADPNRP